MSESRDVEDYVNSALITLFNSLWFDGRKMRKTKDWIAQAYSNMKNLLPTYNFIIYQSELELGELDLIDKIFDWYFPVENKSYGILIFASGTISGFKKPGKTVYFTDGGPEKPKFLKLMIGTVIFTFLASTDALVVNLQV